MQHTLDIPIGPETARGEPLEQAGWFGRSEQQVVSKVRRFPGVAIGAALAMGVMLGWLIKRQ